MEVNLRIWTFWQVMVTTNITAQQSVLMVSGACPQTNGTQWIRGLRGPRETGRTEIRTRMDVRCLWTRSLLLLRNTSVKCLSPKWVTRLFYRTKTASQVCSKWAVLLVGTATRQQSLCVCVCVCGNSRNSSSPPHDSALTRRCLWIYLKFFYRLLLPHGPLLTPPPHRQQQQTRGFPDNAPLPWKAPRRCHRGNPAHSEHAHVNTHTHTFSQLDRVSSAEPLRRKLLTPERLTPALLSYCCYACQTFQATTHAVYNNSGQTDIKFSTNSNLISSKSALKNVD